ncbi:head-tail adaptor protein [Paracoccus ravus]|uniref:head-tail adaptor protein n=1 Tax=Paracoccus ravus TaxID=2447760 RepID=UPI00106E1D98|nr:head-tail adaptor protein [Paracoccus ravus]
MTPPRLAIALTLEEGRSVSDGMGGGRLEWQPVGKLWGEMRSGSGRLQASGEGARSVVTWRILVRSAPASDPRRPKPGQRFALRDGLRHFLIDSVAEEDPQGRYLICIASEEGAA